MLPFNKQARIRKRVVERLERLFPQIGPVRLEHQWNGYIGMTRDYFPRVHRIGPGGFAWAGCNGRGVGLSVALGRDLAKAVQGIPVDQLGLPLCEPDPLPLQGFVRRFAPPIMLGYYRYLDWREV
jgi:glycine/D-amino acid oxidase-like deaminating enzyme